MTCSGDAIDLRATFPAPRGETFSLPPFFFFFLHCRYFSLGSEYDDDQMKDKNKTNTGFMTNLIPACTQNEAKKKTKQAASAISSSSLPSSQNSKRTTKSMKKDTLRKFIE